MFHVAGGVMCPWCTVKRGLGQDFSLLSSAIDAMENIVSTGSTNYINMCLFKYVFYI